MIDCKSVQFLQNILYVQDNEPREDADQDVDDQE